MSRHVAGHPGTVEDPPNPDGVAVTASEASLFARWR
jgi:hypothetical protein